MNQTSLQSQEPLEKQNAGTDEAQDHAQQEHRVRGDRRRYGAGPVQGGGENGGDLLQQGAHGHIRRGFDRFRFGFTAGGASVMDLSFRAAGLCPGVAGAESREILRPGETAPGAGIGRGARSRAGRVRVAGLLPVMIQGGKGFGFRLVAGGALIISKAGGSTGGLSAGGLGPGMVFCEFGDGLSFRLITAGAVIMDGARSGAGGIFTAGLLPIVVQGRGGLLFYLAATGAGIAGPAGHGAGGGCLAGDGPNMAGAKLGDGLRFGLATAGAGIEDGPSGQTGGGGTAGFIPCVIQSG